MTKTDQAGTQSMVRRVASAIREALLAQGGFEESREFILWDGEAHVDCLEAARAAIEAMRELTPGMRMEIRAQNYAEASAQELWDAVIDAALSEEGE